MKNRNRPLVNILHDPTWLGVMIAAISLVIAIPGVIVAVLTLLPPKQSTPNPTPVPTLEHTHTASGLPTPTPTGTKLSGVTPTITINAPTPTSATSPTDWGKLIGDAINVNKQLTCGPGCPEPLHTQIETIQIDTTNNAMTWNAHFSSPIGSSGNGISDASFDFALQSTINSYCQNPCHATTSTYSPGQNVRAKFAFAPDPNDTYTLYVSASYHTVKDGVQAIASTSLQYEPVTISFQP